MEKPPPLVGRTDGLEAASRHRRGIPWAGATRRKPRLGLVAQHAGRLAEGLRPPPCPTGPCSKSTSISEGPPFYHHLAGFAALELTPNLFLHVDRTGAARRACTRPHGPPSECSGRLRTLPVLRFAATESGANRASTVSGLPNARALGVAARAHPKSSPRGSAFSRSRQRVRLLVDQCWNGSDAAANFWLLSPVESIRSGLRFVEAKGFRGRDSLQLDHVPAEFGLDRSDDVARVHRKDGPSNA